MRGLLAKGQAMNKGTETKTIAMPTRLVRDWGDAVMRHCDYCSRYASTVSDEEGGAICAECCDAKHTGDLKCALEDSLQRNAQLIAALEQAQTERDDLKALNQHLDLSIRQAEGVNASIRRRIAELEASQLSVKLPDYRNSPDMHTKQYYEAIGFNQGLDACIEAIRVAGGKVEGSE